MTWRWIAKCTLLLLLKIASVSCQNNDVLVFTFSSKSDERVQRFMQSAQHFKYNVKILQSSCQAGSAEEKPVLLKNALEDYKALEDLLVVCIDSFDAAFLTGPENLVNAFRSLRAKIVFSAESEIQNTTLEEYFPTVKEHEKRFLSSRAFMGYANDLYDMLAEAVQLYGAACGQADFTDMFLNPMRRATLGIKLDTGSNIFQSLEGAIDDVIVVFKTASETTVYNSKLDSYPAILLGDSETSNEFSYISNYVPDRWTVNEGCIECMQTHNSFTDLKVENYPLVLMAVFIEFPTPFIEEFFENLHNLTYPKSRIDLFVHLSSQAEMHASEVKDFAMSHASKYRSIKLHTSLSVESKLAARNLSFFEFVKKSSEYYFAVDGLVQIENSSVIELLMQRERLFVTPMMTRPGKLWSNFWGALSETGYYARSDDYNELIGYNRLGLWNVPFATNIYLMKSELVILLSEIDPETSLDADMIICKTLRDNGVFMYIDNMLYYGHLVEADNYETNHLHNDLYEIFNNRYTWEKKYIHRQYHEYLRDVPWEKIPQPCPDVFWMPLASEKFCHDLIEEMENYGKWSSGTHSDERLSGGYENVPTVDIHTNQIGWEQHWLAILRDYVKPLNYKVFEGYSSDARAIMNFVVRYRPGEMDRLTPHHDASTYTINVALNRPGIDYQGGGPRFLRYNCSVTNTMLGWMLMHPGRLTHYHEGLPVTDGTRYIMVSFVDP